ncbi:MAG: leucine-rich repeat domain-containing protein [Erysipelotrichaceae bacterium]|nr:leucine-rich repeat domain-containing protein [Erysipelotrichaceae bacterium]
MKKNLFKLLFVMLFLLTISFTIVLKNSNFAEADEIVETEEVVEPSLNIYKKNISYSSEIYVMYAVSYEGIDVTTNPVKMLFYNTVQDEYTTQTAAYIAPSKGGTIIDNETCQIFSSNGLAAKQMTDDIYARAYVEVEGQTIYSEVVKYSVLEYYYEIKEAGTASTNILNLLDAMINYGAAAQTNFNYNTEKLANATYYKVSVENAVLPDGFTSGRFKAEEQVTLTAPLKEGYVFTGWTNSNDEVVSTESTYTLTITQDETLTANYIDASVVTLNLTKEVAYDATLSTLDLPTTVTFDYNNETVTENVTWDTTSFVVNQIGKQKLYGTLSNDSYKVNELSIEIDVLPYTFSLNESGNKYTITKYYGNDSEITIPSKFNNIIITCIGDYAFAYCRNLASITIPSSIIRIGDSAFYSCKSLTNVEIPNSVTTIGNKAFYFCESLTSITIPSSVTSIGALAFDDCSSLESITIPSSVTSIERNAFYNCSSLTNVYYEGTIESWCNFLFNDYYSNPMYYADHFYLKNEKDNWYEVTEIVVPDTITEIGEYQFCRFKNVTSITIPNIVLSIGKYAFYNCSSLTNIIIPEGVTSIGMFAFNNCNSLTSITISNSVISIDAKAFEYCNNLSNVYYEGTIEDWCNISFGSSYSNPMYYADYFYMKNEKGDWYEETEIVIPETITEIGDYQFCSFNNFTYIEIPKNLTNIGKDAFYDWTSMENVYYNGTIENWCNILFEGLYSTPMYYGASFYMLTENDIYEEVTEVSIPESITSIGNYQFFCFDNLTSVEIHESVKSIGYGAFGKCSNLEKIVLPESVESIGDSAFRESGLVDVKIYSKISYLSNYMFSGCSSLVSVELPEGLVDLGSDAFFKCSKLETINIPSTVTRLGMRTFAYCSSLTSITIPSGVTGISQLPFAGCSCEILWNNPTIQGFYDFGFADYKGESLIIPNTVKYISSYAFNTCNNLADIYYQGTEEEWNNIEIGTDGNDALFKANIHFVEENKIEIFEENGTKYLYLGKYPQTVVSDESIISNLNNISTTNSVGYIEYDGNEYAKVTANPYGSNYTFTNGTSIISVNVYYFIVEPIKWRVLEGVDGKFKLLSEMLLDSIYFYQTCGAARKINSILVYPNNYEYSNIRAWLNGYDGTSYNVSDYTNKGFIDIAFTEEERNLINSTLVDNSLASTGDSANQYICNDTTDKIYLLSYNEATNTNYGFDNDESRRAIVSDYARSKSCFIWTGSTSYGSGYWWLRSPRCDYFNDARSVKYLGNINTTLIDRSDYGVRPALEITIK